MLPQQWPDLRERYGYGGFPQIEHASSGCARITVDGQPFRDVEDTCWVPERRLADCDRLGIDVQVLSTVPIMFGYWAKPEHGHDLARLLNDHIADLVRTFPTRFVGLGTLPMQAPDLAVRELERCVRELGMAGIQIGTHVNGRNLDDPAVEEVLAGAADLDAAVFVHPWDMLAPERMERYWLRWLVGMPAETALAMCSVIFGGVLDRLPALRLCFAHGGGAFPGTLGRIERGYTARPDLCAVAGASNPKSYLRRLYVDSLTHDDWALRRLLDLMGADRVALGSDYPFPLGEETPGAMLASIADLAPDALRRIRSGTALEFLRLTETEFRS